jgi:hypothetical protein
MILSSGAHGGRPYVHLACSLLRRIAACGTESFETATTREVSSLLNQALRMYTLDHPGRWRCLSGIAELALLLGDWATVIDRLHDILTCLTYDNMNAVLEYTAAVVRRIDIDVIPCSHRHVLLSSYDGAISIMVLTASLALNHSTQLRNVHAGKTLGSGAIALSILMDKLPTGVRLVERTRGIIWSQLLQMRDPHLDDVPIELAQKLKILLHNTLNHRYHDTHLSPFSSDGVDETLYAERNQIQDVIHKIRLLPGLGNFMCGPDEQALLSVASLHPVVILLTHKRTCHALIMTPANRYPEAILLNINPELLADLKCLGLTLKQRGVFLDFGDAETMPRSSIRAPLACARLAKLWQTVVKPIITHLGLSVSAWPCSHVFPG